MSQKHGMSNTKVYRAWRSMIRRCCNPKNEDYEFYGGRGITVAAEWMVFENFYKDMGEPPSPLHSLDRKEVDGNYEPDNCRWATHTEQQNNKRNNRKLTFNGETLSMSEWSRKLNLSKLLIRDRIESGWTPDRTLTTPVRHWSRNRSQ
jgi:hypothetical protein